MEVTAVESTIKNVMDLYYSWLINMIGPKGNDKIALMGTITVHDVIPPAPLYTNYVFRQFADRTISISPEDFGPGNTNDRFSVIYDRLIAVAAAEVYAKATLSDQQTVLIEGYEGDIVEAVQEIKSIRQQTAQDWIKYADSLALKPGTPAYDLERAKYYEPSISLIKVQRQKITKAQAKKRAIWLSVFKNDPDGRQLSEIFENCQAQENQQSLPTDLSIEEKYGLDPITIGAAADSGMFAFETSLGLLPSGTLTKIPDMQGSRDVTFENNQKETHNHDSEWHASGKVGWGLWKANANAQQEEHFRQSIKNLESIKIECDFLGEYWVNRRNWFSSDVFNNKYVKEILKNEPDTVALLSMCISSMIIVRGLRVTYKFEHEDDTTIWSSYSYGGGGGFSVFGIGFGGSGGSSGSKFDHVVNKQDKTVTFSDGENVCRLLALRVSPLMDVSPEQRAFYLRPLDETLLGIELLDAWKSGAVAFGSVPASLAAKQAIKL